MAKFLKGTVNRVRSLAKDWIKDNLPEDYQSEIIFGLPEYHDRYKVWQVSFSHKSSIDHLIGYLDINDSITDVVNHTDTKTIERRFKKYALLSDHNSSERRSKSDVFFPTPVPNKVVLGDCVKVLEDFPPNTAQLIFTSPPYYNAKTQYSEYVDYQEYLGFLRSVIIRCSRVLSEGRFFIINVSPVLLKRPSRTASSKRIPIPFDVDHIMRENGFDFIDDIIWMKPEGAGWNLGRGRRFSFDRKPLQYKPVPVTEYVLVYRKQTNKLIDWNLREHYNQSLVDLSKILGDYDVTNVWRIHPSHSKIHPATFPIDLAEKVIKYYSFKDDLVLDPFAGIGTTALAALRLERRFLMIEKEKKYYEAIKQAITKQAPTNLRIDFMEDEGDE